EQGGERGGVAGAVGGSHDAEDHGGEHAHARQPGRQRGPPDREPERGGQGQVGPDAVRCPAVAGRHPGEHSGGGAGAALTKVSARGPRPGLLGGGAASLASWTCSSTSPSCSTCSRPSPCRPPSSWAVPRG